MIETQDSDSGLYTIHCDECPASTEIKADTFDDMIDELKNEGWRVFKDSRGEWSHACDSCVEDWVEEQKTL